MKKILCKNPGSRVRKVKKWLILASFVNFQTLAWLGLLEIPLPVSMTGFSGHILASPKLRDREIGFERVMAFDC